MKKVKILLSLLLVTGFLGCNVAKREQANLQVYAVRYPDKFKILANTLDPCFPAKAKSDTVITVVNQTLPGDTVTNTVIKKDTVTITQKITLPGTVTNRKITVHDTVIDSRSNSALQAVSANLSDSLAVAKSNYAIAEKKAQHRGLVMWLLIAGIALVIVGKVVWAVYGGGWVSSAKKLI